MAEKSLRHVLKRIDIDLAKEIESYAKNNRLSFREASKDFAKAMKLKQLNKKFKKEIKI